MSQPALESILRCVYGFWGSSILATGLRHRVFAHIAQGANTASALATSAAISPRGSQAILDGLLGLGLLEKTAGAYVNAPAAAAYLLPDSSEYIGGYADMILATLPDWSSLPDAVTSGAPLHSQERADPNNSFWESLVLALAPLGGVPARAAAARLRVSANSHFHMLDIGGGAGAYSATWLGLNTQGRSSQLDWPNVNAIARAYVAGSGHAVRFETIDGDMECIQLLSKSYDYCIYSNVAHGLSKDRNIAMFKRIRAWLNDGGTLVISSLIPNDDRTGDPLLLMFGANLLLNTEQGKLHLRCEYEEWLKEAGFTQVQFEPVVGLPFTLIYAS